MKFFRTLQRAWCAVLLAGLAACGGGGDSGTLRLALTDAPSCGFDAVNLVANAITRAKSANPRLVRNALAETRGFDGVSGGLSYARGSLVPRKAVTVVAVDRRAQVAAEITPAFVPAP